MSLSSAGTGAMRAPVKERGDDLYQTSPAAVYALLKVERLPHFLWECACGPGSIVKVLRAAGHEVIGSDLVDYGDPTHFYGRDFLMEWKAPDQCQAIVSNPPYKLATEFIEHALELVPLVVMLLRLGFVEGVGTRRVRVIDRLARLHVFANRLPHMHREDWDGAKASNQIAFAWYVFERDHRGPALLDRIWWRPEAEVGARSRRKPHNEQPGLPLGIESEGRVA